MINATIITIGDELLIGQVIDTNSAWMAKALNNAGIPVVRRVAVGDSKESIIKALDEERNHAQIILITGGLGPTADDITKPVLCEYFNAKLIVDEGALQNVKYLFEKVFKRPISPVNLKQAEVPDVATVIPNKRGSAPGMWFDKNSRSSENKKESQAENIFISMPGVPHEMKGMMTDFVIPKLKEIFRLPFIFHRTLLTAGAGESFLAEKISEFESALPPELKLAYLPSTSMVRLRLSIIGYNEPEALDSVESHFKTLQELVKEYLVGAEDDSLVQVIGKLLVENKKMMATAESCTGGYIAHLITLVPGSSAFFKGSVISYHDDLKKEILHVKESTLKQPGAVSEQTVKEMINGVLQVSGADFAIAVSGIMGPDGGSSEKPVGTAWIAAGGLLDGVFQLKTKKIQFNFDRARNIEMTSLTALNFFRKFLVHNEKL
ncbi:MAG: CinA family nicotinamide mononucleotide deamidase-related protein [Ginsengibacter sp.]